MSAAEGPAKENMRSQVVPEEFSSVQLKPLYEPDVAARLLDVSPVKTEVYVPAATEDPV